MRCFMACGAPRLASVLLFALAACGPSPSGNGNGDDDDDDGNGGGDGGGGSQVDAATSVDPPVNGACTKMDIVFVVDDSGSMDLEQANLASNFPTFARLLNEYTVTTGEPLDYRAAITTTAINFTVTQTINIPGGPPISLPTPYTGRDGKFVTACGMPRPWLERSDPNMATTFACAANVGVMGSALEMPLRAADLAVKPGTNPGFVREDALLGIIYLTDEDDCSYRVPGIMTNGLEQPCSPGPSFPAASEFVTALDQIKGTRGRWAAAVIAGQTTCESTFGSAVEGRRLKEFATAAGSNVVFGDICAGNLTGALQQALDTFQAACDNFPPIP